MKDLVTIMMEIRTKKVFCFDREKWLRCLVYIKIKLA